MHSTSVYLYTHNKYVIRFERKLLFLNNNSKTHSIMCPFDQLLNIRRRNKKRAVFLELYTLCDAHGANSLKLVESQRVQQLTLPATNDL